MHRCLRADGDIGATDLPTVKLLVQSQSSQSNGNTIYTKGYAPSHINKYFTAWKALNKFKAAMRAGREVNAKDAEQRRATFDLYVDALPAGEAPACGNDPNLDSECFPGTTLFGLFDYKDVTLLESTVCLALRSMFAHALLNGKAMSKGDAAALVTTIKSKGLGDKWVRARQAEERANAEYEDAMARANVRPEDSAPAIGPPLATPAAENALLSGCARHRPGWAWKRVQLLIESGHYTEADEAQDLITRKEDDDNTLRQCFESSLQNPLLWCLATTTAPSMRNQLRRNRADLS